MFCENIHIRNYQITPNENKKTVRYRQETIKFRAPSLWANLLEGNKFANPLNF